MEREVELMGGKLPLPTCNLTLNRNQSLLEHADPNSHPPQP